MCRVLSDLEKNELIDIKQALVQLFSERLVDASMMLLHFAIIWPLFFGFAGNKSTRAGLTLIESVLLTFRKG